MMPQEARIESFLYVPGHGSPNLIGSSGLGSDGDGDGDGDGGGDGSYTEFVASILQEPCFKQACSTTPLLESEWHVDVE